jgi:hypothetical protein
MGHVPMTALCSPTSVPFDAYVCNAEGCGLIADALDQLVK